MPDAPRDAQLAITVLGEDRPGIIAETASVLARLGMNLTDSTMTLLRGHFAMTLICAGPASPQQVSDDLAGLAESGLAVRVEAFAPDRDQPAAGSSVLVTVHGADRLGIVARLAAVIAEEGGNITDLSTRLAGGLYVLLAEVDLPAGVEPAALSRSVADAATALGVEASVQPLERDEL